MRALCVLAAGLVLATLLGACAVEPSELGTREESYLAMIRGATRPLRERARRFEPLFEESRDRDQFLEEFKGIRVLEGVLQTGRRIQKIAAPPRFFDDQKLLLDTLADMVPISNEATSLAERGAVLQSAARHAVLVSKYQRSLTEYSSRFCQRVATTTEETDLCDPEGILPGGVYGDRLHAILARLSAEFTPRGFLFIGQHVYTNTEVAQYLQIVHPEILKALVRAKDAIGKLVPTDELVADHRVIQEYFDEFTRVAEGIAEAVEGNPGRLNTLFPRSQQVVNRARDRLSAGIRPAVAVWFFPSD